MSLRLSKKISLTGLVLITLIIGGITYAVKSVDKNGQNRQDQNQNAPTNQASGSSAPEKLSVNAAGPENKAPVLPVLDKSLPSGTIEPSTVTGNPEKYVNRQLQIRGLLMDIGDDKYDLADQKPDKNSHSLRISSSLDLNKYSNSTSLSKGPLHFANPVTVTGKLAGIKKGQPLTLEVESIE